MQNLNDSFCLSFSSYSTDNLVNVAIKVTHEQYQLQYAPPLHVNAAADVHFEFVHISADSVVSIGEMTSAKQFPADPVFPLFNRNILLDNENHRQNRAVISPARRSLKKLFIDNQRDNEEDEELERIEPATYCVWSPLKTPDRCKKSNSTGNLSKRWSFLRDLLKRSHSDGGELVRSSWKSTPDHRLNSNLKVKAKVSSSTPSTSHRAFYRTAAAMEVDKKKKIKSYLPYRTFLGSFPMF